MHMCMSSHLQNEDTHVSTHTAHTAAHTCMQRFSLGLAGAERLLRHLHAHGVPFALATSSHQRHFAVKTQRHTELFALFRHRVTGAWLWPPWRASPHRDARSTLAWTPGRL